MNFSSHQKHSPFSLRSSNSWFFIDLVGLLEVMLNEFWELFGQEGVLTFGMLLAVGKVVVVRFGWCMGFSGRLWDVVDIECFGIYPKFCL